MNKTPSKKIFLIRHGQTQANVDKVFQDAYDPLTELGREQIECLAKRSVELNPDVIISSTMQRALETAQEVQKATGAPLFENEHLGEYMVPSSLLNKPYSSDESKSFHRELQANMDDPEWHYADEENYHDLFLRAQKVMDMLTEREEKRLLVVSHGAFMAMLLTSMMHEGEPSPASAKRMFRFFRRENTGISIIDYYSDATVSNKWRLKVWNDYSHLPRELRTLK